MTLFRAALLTVILFTASSWNKPGHQVTGSIAYQYLNENSPATVTKVVNLMKKHPEFNTRWKSTYDGLSAADKSMYLFMVAAEWPDIIKDDNPNNYPVDRNCHYINWPVTFDAGTHVDQPDPVNSLSQLKTKLQILNSTKPAADKAMALCWVFHLLGDLHQPLHNVALFGTGFPPDGDHGGNNFFVKKLRLPILLNSMHSGMMSLPIRPSLIH